MKSTPLLTFLSLLWVSACSAPEEYSFSAITGNSPSIEGKKEYLSSPYVTAGDRVYMVGHQDGSFPELGWHIPGEMGGIWNHPIKLFDGFTAHLSDKSGQITLDNAVSFINYPYANVHQFNIPEKSLRVNRWQFVPDGKESVFVEFEIFNESTTDKTIDFTVDVYSDLSPTWLGKRTEMNDGNDRASFTEAMGAWVFEDSESSWFAAASSNIRPINIKPLDSPFKGKGAGAQFQFELLIPANSSYRMPFALAGSYLTKDQTLHTLQRTLAESYEWLQAKKERYEELALQSKLTVPDKDLEQTFEWLKYNADWLVRTVPEIGSGIGAGIPDYPWWFGVDSEYALQGYMAVGQRKAVYNTIALLDSVSNAVNGNGRIIHEMSTNGVVFNPGNINETPQFATLIREIYHWNGDRDFLEKYFPTIESGLSWLLTENDENENLFPDGYGMMEIHGLSSEMIDVASYTQKAFVDAAFMARELGKNELAQNYEMKATELTQRINDEFWSDEFDSYADFIGTDEQALRLIDDAIVRADTLNKPWAVEELKATRQAILNNPSEKERPFVVHHNWVVNTPMEVGLADPEKALIALETAEQFVNPFGVFVTGIDRDESAGSNDGSFKGSKVFSYTGAVMTLPTGVQVIAENNYGRPDQALNYLQRMVRTFSYALPGSMYEVSPDYGMMTQAWNIYSFAVPITRQFFGVHPRAADKTLYISPQMPSAWHSASLENVLIGDKLFSFYYTRTNDEQNVRVEQDEPKWTIVYVDGDNPILSR